MFYCNLLHTMKIHKLPCLPPEIWKESSWLQLLSLKPGNCRQLFVSVGWVTHTGKQKIRQAKCQFSLLLGDFQGRYYKTNAPFLCVCVCEFGFNVAFNNFSVISRRCLVATGSSMLTFIVLPHWSIMSQTLDMIPHPVTLSWHWVDQS